MHVVRLARIVRDDEVERRIHPIDRVTRFDPRRVGKVVLRQVGQDPANRVESIGLVARGKVRNPTPGRMRLRPTQELGVNRFMGHRLHHVWPGHEHIARMLDHDREVGHRRRVDGTASARSHHHRDLRHHPGGEHIAQKDLRVATERCDAFLDPRTAGIVQSNDRRTDLHGKVEDLADLFGVGLGKRTTEHREVLAEDEYEPAIDGAVASHHAIAEDMVFGETEFRRAMGHEGIELNERTWIEQQVEPLAGGQLAPRVLALDANRSPAEQGFGAHLVEAAKPFFIGRHRRFQPPPVLAQRRDPMIVVQSPPSNAVACAPARGAVAYFRARGIPCVVLGYPQIR